MTPFGQRAHDDLAGIGVQFAARDVHRGGADDLYQILERQPVAAQRLLADLDLYLLVDRAEQFDDRDSGQQQQAVPQGLRRPAQVVRAKDVGTDGEGQQVAGDLDPGDLGLVGVPRREVLDPLDGGTHVVDHIHRIGVVVDFGVDDGERLPRRRDEAGDADLPDQASLRCA